MPQKEQHIDWDKYNQAMAFQQDVEQAQEGIEALTPRQLYEMPSYTNVAKYLIKRPSEYAMHGTITNYPLDPVEIIENTLIDGISYFKVEDIKHIRRNEFVYKADIDQWTEDLLSILTCYPIEDGAYYYWESWQLNQESVMDEQGKIQNAMTCTYTQYYKTPKCDATAAENLKAEYMMTLPFMPWVKAAWKHGISFIGEIKESIVRLESVYRIVSTTNNEGGRSYITGIDSLAKVQSTPLNFGIGTRILPKDASFIKDPVDAGRNDLLKWETERLWDGIEKSTGVVSVDKLTVLSGESRTIAEKPLLMLAEDLRMLFNNLLTDIYELIIGLPGTEEPTISYMPLRVPVAFATPESEVDVLDRALEKVAIDDEEWIQKVRYLLGFDSNK